MTQLRRRRTALRARLLAQSGAHPGGRRRVRHRRETVPLVSGRAAVAGVGVVLATWATVVIESGPVVLAWVQVLEFLLRVASKIWLPPL